MSVHEDLLKLIESKIKSTKFEVTSGLINEFDKYICKISLKGTSSNPEIDMDGEMISRSTLLLVNVQSDIGTKGRSDGYEYCENIINVLTKLWHESYINEDGVRTVTIDNVRLRGDINPLSVNSQAVYCFSINFIINYV